jgi:hypothetical protein
LARQHRVDGWEVWSWKSNSIFNHRESVLRTLAKSSTLSMMVRLLKQNTKPYQYSTCNTQRPLEASIPKYCAHVIHGAISNSSMIVWRKWQTCSNKISKNSQMMLLSKSRKEDHNDPHFLILTYYLDFVGFIF